MKKDQGNGQQCRANPCRTRNGCRIGIAPGRAEPINNQAHEKNEKGQPNQGEPDTPAGHPPLDEGLQVILVRHPPWDVFDCRDILDVAAIHRIEGTRPESQQAAVLDRLPPLLIGDRSGLSISLELLGKNLPALPWQHRGEASCHE